MTNILNNLNYFYRNATFTRKNNQVALVNIDDPEQVSVLDDWLGVVVSLADGKHTIKELIEYMSHQYVKAPDNLDKTIHSVLNRLIEGDIVRLSEGKVELPYYLAEPVENMDIDKARALILKDGYAFEGQGTKH